MIRLLKRTLIEMLPPAIVGTLRGWRVRRLVAAFPSQVVEHTYGVGPLKVLLADPLSRGWYDHDWAELPEIEALRGTRLRAGARVFDLGAHQGVVALMLAREVGPSGLVVAVEANPHNAAVAARNRDLNDMAQIEIIQAAIVNRAGQVIFNEGLDGQLDDGSGSGGRIRVEGITLDSLADRFGLPDVVMIDVEGAECLALEGGARVLASGAVFAVEVHIGCGLEKLGGSVQRLFAYFPAGRFDVLVRRESDDRFVPVGQDDTVVQDRFFALALAREAS